jgi:hypothetical protein
MDNKKLQIQQLDKRMKLFAQAQKYPIPTTGWIRPFGWRWV